MATKAGIDRLGVNGGKVPQSVNSTFGPCRTLHEWLVFPLRGCTEYCGDAAFSTLRAHAAGKPNSQNGLEAAVRCALSSGFLGHKIDLDRMGLKVCFGGSIA